MMTTQKPLLSLIFPAYNEVKRIHSTIDEAVIYLDQKQISYEIIVAADGNDGTREKVSEMSQSNPNITSMGSINRCGKGFGIRQAVSKSNGSFVGFADADNKTPISDLEKFMPFLYEGCDLVIGTRAGRETIIERPQPLYRRIGSRGFGIFMHLVVGLWDIADTQCGFKFFQGEVAKDLFSRQIIDGYMFDVEILFLAKQLGYQIKQVPVRWRDDRDSRLDLVMGNLHNVYDIFKIRFHRYSGKKHGFVASKRHISVK